jgi:hypothetical protein
MGKLIMKDLYLEEITGRELLRTRLLKNGQIIELE